ncbi:hypothetical protein WMF18_28965 [Sorangium sp. So ce315]|uniref:hypothetical protein n=1 Tax=Sorangium sp. So ce315 TaxID=3133299 RepID=UPI003F60C5D4
MRLRDILASWLSGSRDSSLEPSKRAEQQRATFAAAEREGTEATRRRDELAAALAAAEQAYDSDPSDENGAKVLRAREAHDLAALRATRAGKRLEEARAALEAAERDVCRARLLKARAEAAARAPELRRAVDSARAAVARSNPAAALAHVVATFERGEEQARAELASATAELEALPVELERIEAELVSLAPELSDDVAAARSARAGEARAELARRVSLEAFRETIAGDLATIAAAEALAEKHRARAAAALAAQRSAAVEASKLGLEAKPLADEVLSVHVAHARYLARPAEQRDARAHAAELWRAMRPEDHYVVRARVSHDEVIELCLSAPDGAHLARALAQLCSDRAYAAGDINEINRRAQEAQARHGRPPSVRYAGEIEHVHDRPRPFN